MLEFGACPRCKMDISAERKSQSLVICNNCGYTASPNRQAVNNAVEKRTIILYSTFLAVFLGSFIQLTNWDNYSLDIIPLKIKETIGMSNQQDNEKTAQICMDLKKWDCVETNYSKVGNEDATKLPRLGQFQMKRAKYNEAAHTFYGFFQKGGTDLEASYSYAKALAQLGQVDEATKYFEQVLGARPDVLQVTVVQNYVKVLMEHKRYDQALKLIKNIRSKGPETGSFMEVDYKKIQDTMATASRE
ncbi:MAG: tetratricopeptide repeat protein [Bdellovibrionales bacterium]